MSQTLTPRQQREREFYNEYSRQRRDMVSPEPILGNEKRPWNPYWHFFRLAREAYRPGSRLLDFGCGWGSNTVLFALAGYQVDGIDIAENNLEKARELAQEHGVSRNIRLHLQPAEQLAFPDQTFDVVAGIDILHHVQIEPALREVARVLKPGGVAFFREPVEQPLFDAIRNTWLVRRFFPKEASLDRHITHDERKLTHAELAGILRMFPRHRVDHFRVLSRLGAVCNWCEAALEKLDLHLRWLPGYQWLSGTVVLSLYRDWPGAIPQALEKGGAANLGVGGSRG